MKTIIHTATLLFFALHFIVFGANKFFMFANVPPPTDPKAIAFMGGMFGSYLASLVGLIEIAGAVLLLLPRTRLLGLLMLLPVTVNIAAYHLCHDLPGNGIWLFTVAAQLFLMWPHRARLAQLAQA
jgi:putative oxidoreductase